MTLVFVPRSDVLRLTCLFVHHGAGDAHVFLKSIGLVVDGDPVVDFQHLHNACEFGDDLVLDPHLLLHLPSRTVRLTGKESRRRRSVASVGAVVAEMVRVMALVGGDDTTHTAVVTIHAVLAA